MVEQNSLNQPEGVSQQRIVRQIDEKQKEKQTTEKINRDRGIFLKIITSIICIILLISIGFYKHYNPEFKTLWLVLIILAICIIFIVFFFSHSIFKFFKKEDESLKPKKLPRALAVYEAKPIVKKLLAESEYADIVTGWDSHWTEDVGKNTKCTILCVKLSKTLYNRLDECYVLINLNYPLEKNAIINNPTTYELNKRIGSLGVDPEDPMDIEVVEREDRLTGNILRISRNSKHDEKKEEKSNESGGLK